MNKLRIFLLLPIEILWEWIYRIRRLMYSYGMLRKSYFRVPVISIGNITFGGTGKTPFTIWLANYFNSIGLRSLILTRGYKGKFENSADIIHCGGIFGVNPSEYGDEPALMSRKMKNAAIVVGKKRSQNLKYYFDRVSPDVVLLDDGFQHLKIDRNLNIVLFDGVLPLFRYRVAPNGYLREGLTALRDADIVVVNNPSQSPLVEKKLENMITSYCKESVTISRTVYRPTGLFNAQYEKVHEVDQLNGMKALVVAGIASPDSFCKTLMTLGVEIVEFHAFPDHHQYSFNEIDELLTKAAQQGLYLITSEKDITKIRRISISSQILYLEVGVHFLSGKNNFLQVLESKISSIKNIDDKSVQNLELVKD